MAKVTAPMLSLGASGTFGDAITFAAWKGIAYARQRVIPSNPNTTAQQAVRNAFTFSTQVWKNAPSLVRDPWNRYAQGVATVGYSEFVGFNTRNLNGQSDLVAFVGSPGAKGGPPADAIVITPGSEQLSVAFTTPTPPTGWTLDSIVAMAIRDQDPASETLYTIVADEDDTGVGPVVLTGLTATELYLVSAWPIWTRPDGTSAYGPSINDTATPTA